MHFDLEKAQFFCSQVEFPTPTSDVRGQKYERQSTSVVRCPYLWRRIDWLRLTEFQIYLKPLQIIGRGDIS